MARTWGRRREGTADEVLVRQLYQEHGGALRLNGTAGLELRLPAWRVTS